MAARERLGRKITFSPFIPHGRGLTLSRQSTSCVGFKQAKVKLLVFVCLFVFLRIYVDLAVFQPYLDLEAGENHSLKIQVARPGIKPRSSCSASQELNHSATTAPVKH